MIGNVTNSSGWTSQALNTQSATQRHQEMFAKLDTNGDRKIDASELKAGAPADGRGKDVVTMMKEADTSGDGTIDAAENEAFLSKMDSQAKPSGPPPGGGPAGGPPPAGGGAKAADDSSSTVYDSRDTNKDGVVSLQERLAAAAKSMSDQDIQEMLQFLTQNAASYDGQGQGVVDAAGGIVNTVA